MEVSGQLHALANPPLEKSPSAPTEQAAGWGERAPSQSGQFGEDRNVFLLPGTVTLAVIFSLLSGLRNDKM